MQHEEKAHFGDKETQSSGLSFDQLCGVHLFDLFKEGSWIGGLRDCMCLCYNVPSRQLSHVYRPCGRGTSLFLGTYYL